MYQILSIYFDLNKTLSKVDRILIDLMSEPYYFVSKCFQVYLRLKHRLLLYHLDLICGQLLLTVLDFYYFLISKFISLYDNIESAPAIIIIFLYTHYNHMWVRTYSQFVSASPLPCPFAGSSCRRRCVHWPNGSWKMIFKCYSAVSVATLELEWTDGTLRLFSDLSIVVRLPVSH